VGTKINDYVLRNKRADYREKTVATVSQQLENNFGRGYSLRNVRRMMQFAEQFPESGDCDTTGDTIELVSA